MKIFQLTDITWGNLVCSNNLFRKFLSMFFPYFKYHLRSDFLKGLLVVLVSTEINFTCLESWLRSLVLSSNSFWGYSYSSNIPPWFDSFTVLFSKKFLWKIRIVPGSSSSVLADLKNWKVDVRHSPSYPVMFWQRRSDPVTDSNQIFP